MKDSPHTEYVRMSRVDLLREALELRYRITEQEKENAELRERVEKQEGYLKAKDETIDSMGKANGRMDDIIFELRERVGGLEEIAQSHEAMLQRESERFQAGEQVEVVLATGDRQSGVYVKYQAQFPRFPHVVRVGSHKNAGSWEIGRVIEAALSAASTQSKLETRSEEEG